MQSGNDELEAIANALTDTYSAGTVFGSPTSFVIVFSPLSGGVLAVVFDKININLQRQLAGAFSWRCLHATSRTPSRSRSRSNKAQCDTYIHLSQQASSKCSFLQYFNPFINTVL